VCVLTAQRHPRTGQRQRPDDQQWAAAEAVVAHWAAAEAGAGSAALLGTADKRRRDRNAASRAASAIAAAGGRVEAESGTGAAPHRVRAPGEAAPTHVRVHTPALCA